MQKITIIIHKTPEVRFFKDVGYTLANENAYRNLLDM